MANRKLPFGYEMRRGQICIAPHEADVVHEIFKAYGDGASYQQIAERLNARAIPYSTQGKSWNKNTVARILQDGRRMGGSGYPQIITSEHCRRAALAKPTRSGTAEWAELKDIRILARCSLCHGPMRRERKNVWSCPHCRGTDFKIKDEPLIQCVGQLLRRLCGQPDSVLAPDADAVENETVQQAQSAFANELDRPEFNESAAKTAVLALAAARFNALGSQDYETMRIRHTLRHTEQTDGLDTELLRKITAAILLHPTGAVSLKLKNKQIVERGDST